MAAWSDQLLERLRQATSRMAGEDLSPKLAALRPSGEYGVDDFGFDPQYALAALAPLLWLYKHYFRVEAHGVDNVPAGRVLLVSNHAGQLPLDGAMIGIALLTQRDPPRVVRSMVEKWIPTLPFASTVFARMGQIVGTPENCRRLLQREEAILVFPEGVKGISKTFDKRYQLQDFGLGFMRLALESQAPVVPVAVVGSEEQAPVLVDTSGLARLLGMPALPVTPYGPPLPLPTKYRLYFGEPLRFGGSVDDDEEELERKVAQVKGAVEQLLKDGLSRREAIFW